MTDTTTHDAGSAPRGPSRRHDVPVTQQTGPVAPRRPAAAVLPAVGLACLVVTGLIALRVADRPVLWTLGEGVTSGTGLGTALAGAVLCGLAGVVLRHGGHRTLGLALGGTGLFWSTDGVAEAWIALGLVTPEALPGLTFAGWYLLRFTSLLPASLALLPLIFPDGRFLPGWWGRASWACMAAMVSSALLFTLMPDRSRVAGQLPPGYDRDWGVVPSLVNLGETTALVFRVLTVLALAVPVGVVTHRYRHSAGRGRDQMRWLLWGALVTVSAIAVASVLPLGPLDDVVFFLVVVLLPVCLTVAVVHPQVVAIDELLGRTVMLALVAGVLVAIDLATVAGITWVLGVSLEEPQVVVVVLLLTVVLYTPLRQRLSRWVRRLMLGRGDRYDAVAGLATALETTDEGAGQLAAVARAVADAFGVGFVAVEVERGGGERLVATHGTRPAQTRTLPISYRGAPVGRLVLPAKGLRSRLTRADEALLGDLVRQAATAARTSRLAEELQDSRERLVTAREEERRRIRRDLHDGLGPALAGAVFQLESACLLVDRDPEGAKARVAATSGHLQEVVADVRRLVHDLRPPALDDLGLVGALRQQASRLDPPATVEADELPPLPAAVEVAAFRVVSEAMANVARHARARACTVLLRAEEGVLHVEVTDDGIGIAEGSQAGIGLIGLRERASELGGSSDVTCPAGGGTVVTVRLPLRRTP